MSTRANGWYPDPQDDSKERWFEKGSWTDKNRRAAGPANLPLPSAEPVDTKDRPMPPVLVDIVSLALIVVGVIEGIPAGGKALGVILVLLGVAGAFVLRAHVPVRLLALIGGVLAALAVLAS